MNREHVVRWLSGHPGAVQGAAEEFVEQCERTVRRHASEDAWSSAKRYVEVRMHDWEGEWGARAGEAHVATEVCRQLAFELRSHEPEVKAGDEDHLAGGPLHDTLSPEGWEQVCEWIRDIAQEEEHRVWREIVRFTSSHGRRMVREHGLSEDHDWEHTRPYLQIAAEIAADLAREYSIHAYPRSS